MTAPNQQLASEVGFAAEKYRRQLAREWLGRELPDWPQPCVITARINRQAFGETSFSFAGRGRKSRPFDFVMQVNGSRERILDSVLPHEISHTIFATHFGQPLPRWADEGACTTVEHVSERRKNHRMLIEFLTTGRGIPFNSMFAMKQYPRDILPLYAQGYSLCRFLIQRGGKIKFVQFMEDGVDTSNWNTAVRQHYGIRDLSALQVQWLGWVKEGCPGPYPVDQAVIQSGSESSRGAVTAKADYLATRTDAPAGKDGQLSDGNAFPGSQPDTSTEIGGNFYFNEIQRAKNGVLLR
ncbi:MAG: hypothetical protein VX768_21000 [Planctomycetota bacterium]|nr:hypothetical protein [Planctomycetota bacterium]